ncbi:hypothetical protein OUZ56_025284 [Daphnia magna]|uniref:Uncharacterized protein n=1 Tax=Daphnia magna TaxID=35525 RepID=A0ABQ9ZJD6_9CRUS|nr:hypothetical protein OUZ56_025284 [Daphnia magna]
MSARQNLGQTVKNKGVRGRVRPRKSQPILDNLTQVQKDLLNEENQMLLEESSDEPPDQLLTADGTEWLVVDSGNEDEEIIPSSPKVPDPPPNTQPIPAFKQYASLH